MSALLLQTENLLSNAGMTVLIGVVVVFSVLLILTFVFWLFGKIASAGSSTTAPAATPKAPIVKKPVVAPVVEDGIPEEVVAVIAAAVAAMSDDTTRYAVRRISAARVQGSRPVWAAAGIAQNTQPF